MHTGFQGNQSEMKVKYKYELLSLSAEVIQVLWGVDK